MDISIAGSELEFDQIAGWKIVGQMLEKVDSVIGLSTGQTTGAMHRMVAELHARHPFDVSQITLFGLDEVNEVPSGFPATCAELLLDEIVRPIGLPLANFLMPDADCGRIEAELQLRGGIDLLMLGIGTDGHLGMNMPGTPFESDTHCTKLRGEMEHRIRSRYVYPEPNPLSGITLGIRTIMRARHIVLVAKGTHKAEIVERALKGPIVPEVPASVLQLHPNCEFLLDPEAGARVRDMA